LRTASLAPHYQETSTVKAPALVILLAGLAVAGCADECRVPPINCRPGTCIDKKALPTDVVLTTEITSNPAGLPVTLAAAGERKARVSIEENYLAFYSEEGAPGVPAARSSVALAIFAALAHFDPYSPCGRQPTEEYGPNPEDPLWSLRRYMRADWSKNLVGEQVLAGPDGARVEPTVWYWADDASSDWDCGPLGCSGSSWPPVQSWKVRQRVLVLGADAGTASGEVDLLTTFRRASL
jgi:hypothetical protein